MSFYEKIHGEIFLLYQYNQSHVIILLDYSSNFSISTSVFFDKNLNSIFYLYNN